MKITKVEKVTEERELLTDVICNKCGNSCRPKEYNTDFYGLIEATVTGGFDSPALADACAYTFSMCEPCLKELFDSFKFSVDVTDYLL